jgi:hypothetical protein
VVSFFVDIIIELSNEVHFVYLIKSFSQRWFLHILEKRMNRNASCLFRKMFSFVICHSLIIIMETDFLWSQKQKASHLVIMLLGQSNEISSVLFFRVCIVDNHAFSFQNLFLSHFVTFFLCFQCIPVNS